MENKHDMTAERQSLRDKLTAIILLETSKDHKEMDSGLVTECVDFLMELEGKQRLTKAEIEKRVSEIPFKGKVTAISSNAKKKMRAKRIAVIAAVLAVLLAIFSIVAISLGSAEDSIVDRYIKQIVEFMKCGDGLAFENIELIKPNESKTYSSAEELVRDEKIAILFPTRLPDNGRITKCWYFNDVTNGRNYVLQCKNPDCGITIYLDANISDEIRTDNPMKIIGEYSVYITVKDGLVQGMFEYNGYFYSVGATTEEELLNIIENLKEIK
ncbi:MAG: hypothetical protein IJO36_04730 [Clostridia bacterium]|nr:hypothetical protein [Clostridia bacterium]